MNGQGLSGSVSAQAEQFQEIVRLVSSLTQNPPGEIRNAFRGLSDFRMPNMDFAGVLLPMLGRVRGVLPTDLTGAMGDLPSRLERLSAVVSGQLTPDLERVLGVIRAVRDLATLDFHCRGDVGATAGGTGPGGSPPSGSPPGGSPPGGGPSGATGENSSTARAAASAISTLDRLPSPLNAGSLINFLREIIILMTRGYQAGYPIPVAQEIIDPLETLSRWDDMTSAQIATDMAGTLEAAASLIRDEVRGSLNAVLVQAADLAVTLSPGELVAASGVIAASLDEIRASVNAGDVSQTGAAVAAIEGALDRLDAIRAAFDEGERAKAASLADALPRLGEVIAARMDHVVITLEPSAGLGHLAGLSGTINTPEVPEAITELQDQVRVLTGWLQDLVDRLDVSAVEAGLTPAAAAMREAAEAIDSSLISVTLAVREKFDAARQAIDGIDTGVVRDALRDVVEAARRETTQRLSSGLAPVRGAVSGVVGNISDAVDAVDLQAVVEGLRDVVERLVGVLDLPEIAQPLEAIRSAVKQAEDGVASFSFTPAVDPIVAGIDGVTEKLRAINPDDLSDTVKMALAGALAVLPENLQSPIGTLTVGFDGIVSAGPVRLVESAKAGPEAVMRTLRGFEPSALIGEALSKPFTQAVSQAERFRPRELFSVVEAEIEKIRKRIRETANLDKAIEPAQKEFEKVLAAVDALSPSSLLAPVDEAIQRAIDDVISATPIDEILSAIERVLSPIRTGIDAVERISRVVRRMEEVLRELDDAPRQFDEWVDGVLDRIRQISDTTEIELALGDVATALDAVTGDALRDRLATGYEPASRAFQDARPGDRLAQIVQARLRFPEGELEALPASSARDAITAMLTRLSATSVEFGRPFIAGENLALACRRADDTFARVLDRWDSRYHDATASLPGLRRSSASAEEIRRWVADALEWQMRRPVRMALSFIKPIRIILTAVTTPLRELADDLAAKAASLATGPNSIGAIAGSMQEIVDRLRGINIGFVREGLGEIHTSVRSRLGALSPRTLGEPIKATFDAMLDDVSLNLVIEPSAISDLDRAYEAVIEALKALDPGRMVIDVVQPEFEARLGAIVEAFDLAATFDAVIAKLEALKAELKAELDRVDGAYVAMRGAVPAGISLGISVDIGVSVGF